MANKRGCVSRVLGQVVLEGDSNGGGEEACPLRGVTLETVTQQSRVPVQVEHVIVQD